MKTPEFLTALPIAHRGLHDDTRPENGYGAFLAAIEHGFPIETDVRFSADGRLVVFHDDGLSRMTGDERTPGECTATELKHLRLAGTNEQIPLLSELLKWVGGKVPLLIEIKNMKGVKPKRIARALAEALEGYTGEFAVQSFQPFYVKAFKKLRPDVPCGVLGTAEKGAAKGIQGYVIKRLPFNFLVRPDFISYRLEDLPRKKTEKFKGVRLAWTVRSEKDFERARKVADNVIFEKFIPQTPTTIE